MTNTLKVLLQPSIVLELLKLTLKFPKNEFCGFALFEMFGEPFEEQVVLHHFLPLNVGDASTTNYTELGDIVEFRMNNPELAHYRIGTVKIHSHNTMSSFFSGTDQQDLEKNAEGTDLYFSLVVNNELNFFGKACRVVEVAQCEKTYTVVVENKKQEIKVTVPAKKERIVQDCSFEILHSYPQWFLEAFNKLKLPEPKVFSYNSFPQYGGGWKAPQYNQRLMPPNPQEVEETTFEDQIREVFQISDKVKDLVKYFSSGQKVDMQAMYDSLESFSAKDQDIFFDSLGEWIDENKLTETAFHHQVVNFIEFVEFSNFDESTKLR